MPLTPADVHNVVFKKPTIGTRGYDEDEVDAFLDVVEGELARLIEENNDLRASRSDAVTEEPPGAPVAAAPHPVAQPRDDDDVPVPRMLALAIETADRYVGEAKQKAEQTVANAKNTSKQMVTESRATSKQMISEARTRADSIIDDARTHAETMERAARTRAAAVDREAERLHREIKGTLEERRRRLEHEITHMRAVEREYRTSLRSYLQSQMRDLDRRGSAQPSSTTRQSQPLPA
jgi:DivIVA domain-containing protein